MARTCGICRRALREDSDFRHVRLREEDVPFINRDASREDDYAFRRIDESGLGLYAACDDCTDAHRLRLAQRLDVDPETLTNRMLA